MTPRARRRFPAPLIPAAALAGLALLAGCAGEPPGTDSALGDLPFDDPTLQVLTEGCDPLGGDAAPAGELVFALGATVDPRRAPVPHNLAEQVVFQNLYETLVQVDCEGRLRPGLARAWERREDGALWLFELREDAVFWDGTPVTAAAVADCWSREQGCPRTGDAPSPWTWLSMRSESVVVVDARVLALQLPEPSEDLPYLLAHPSLAVAARRDGWTWPVGSGPCRLSATTLEPLPDLVCRPNLHHPERPAWERLVFRVLPGVDPRDLPARGADLLLVSGSRERDFLAGLGGMTVAPLPWDRLYLLVTPPARPGSGADPPRDPIDPLALARDDVAQEALAWDSPVLAPLLPGDCPQLAGPVAESEVASVDWEPAPEGRDRDAVIYRADDETAARIAARIAAVQGLSRARGLRTDHFAFALRERQGRAFLVQIDRSLPTACLQLAGLLGRAAWLQAAVASEPAPDAPGEPRVPGNDLVARRLMERRLAVPLVAVRNHVAARDDVRGLRVAWDGTPLVAGLGRAADPGRAADTGRAAARPELP